MTDTAVPTTDVPTTHDVAVEHLPADFRWGAATAAYQIEGGVSEGGRGPSIWDTFSHTPGKTRNGETGDVACDHFHRWPEDLELARTVGLNSYRMSLSWARLQPTGRGPLNPHGVRYYRSILERLRELRIEPLVTLYHWDLPQALEDAGGWPVRDTAQRFADYAAQVTEALGDLVTDWITLNEPWCTSFLGYGTGYHAPGRQSIPDAVAAAHHLNLAHGWAVDAIRSTAPAARIGVANLLVDVEPASTAQADVAAAARWDANSNLMFLEPVLTGSYSPAVLDLYEPHGLTEHIRDGDGGAMSRPLDFLGINHYQRMVVLHDPDEPHLGARAVHADPVRTATGWSFRPESLVNVLLRVQAMQTGLPIHVTESGASFHDAPDPSGQVIDLDRVEYLHGYIGAAVEAVRRGVDLRGYYVWSLLDNFEWAEGYHQRFGLVHVDYATQNRTLKTSARWYERQIRRHAEASRKQGQR